LLNNRGFTISEVGFKVGFNDPKYFSRCFQKEFHMTPTHFQEQKPQHYDELHVNAKLGLR
jgi:AraC-like DNA-binding protein